jgi:hypothetical protein
VSSVADSMLELAFLDFPPEFRLGNFACRSRLEAQLWAWR